MTDLENILNNIKIKQSREESKKVIREMKNDGITKEEIKALYVGFISEHQKYIVVLPLLILWIEEVWDEI